MPIDIKKAAKKAFALRHKLDYLRKKIREYNRRLEGGDLLSFAMHSQRYLKVEMSLSPETPEPPRHDIEQAPAYAAWAINEVARLEQLARVMLQQLRVGDQEIQEFENIMCWLSSEEQDFLEYMSEKNSLEGFFSFSKTFDDAKRKFEEQKKQTEKLEDAIHNQIIQIWEGQKEVERRQLELERIIRDSKAFYERLNEQDRERKNSIRIQENNLSHNNQVQNDNNMISTATKYCFFERSVKFYW